jgi:hypothetical protein
VAVRIAACFNAYILRLPTSQELLNAMDDKKAGCVASHLK